ncbi:MAG TPA: hypothetical protein VMF09_01110 [Solirubrobacteraceae bacterium]|nr:hypothetical protein [Solirubrobacteraceae bacterium]
MSRSRRYVLVAAGALAAAGLAACGSAGATRSATAPASAASASAAPALPACAATVADTLEQVAQRIYRVAASGEDVTEAVDRVRASQALADAIDGDDARAARAALNALLLKQIVRIEVLERGRVFASAGAGAAIAPVRGSIPGTSASFVLSVQARRNYAQVAGRVTGAQVRLSSGAAGRARAANEASFGASLYPAGGLRVMLAVPAAKISCPGRRARVRVETLGHVGERIYEEERDSTQATATLRLLEGSRAFRRAVAERSPSATRAAIVGFFEEHLHVVRVRVTIGGRLLVDVGGPYVLAPVRGTLREHGRVIGRFEMAIQDDAGYLKLARLFTGAQVLMRVGGRQIMGTLEPGPARVPERGSVSYEGRTYQTYSFTGEAFPSGPLRMALLVEP